MSIYAKIIKAYKNYRLLRRLRKELAEHDGILFLHDTHFSRAVPNKPKFLIYDCVDLPLMHQRTSRARREKNKLVQMLIDFNAKRAVSKSDLILLTSPYYKRFIGHWINKDIPSILLRNFGRPKTITIPPSSEMESELQSYRNVTHWIVIHNRIGEFLDIDAVFQGLSNLKQSWGLCLLGVFDGKNTIAELEKRAQKYCPNHTVFCHDALYGEEKIAALKCFDLGAVPLISDSQNLQRCIPNRALELLSIGLPQIVTRTRSLKKLSAEFPDNIFVPERGGQVHFEHALQKICEQIELNKISVSSVAIPNWDEDFFPFLRELNKKLEGKNVTNKVVILSENNPQKNSRLSNIQKSLNAEGYMVEVLEIDSQHHKIQRHVS